MRRKNIFLYLTLACFLGLLAIFTVDGYMGIYDTVYITAGEQSWKIESDVWLREYPTYAPAPIAEPMPVEGGKGAYLMPSNRQEKAGFRYEIDNRRFSNYTANIEVTVWRSQQKILDLISQPIEISAFDKGQVEWVIDNIKLLPKDILPEQSYQYTIIIKRGGIERRIVVSINPLPSPARKF